MPSLEKVPSISCHVDAGANVAHSQKLPNTQSCPQWTKIMNIRLFQGVAESSNLSSNDGDRRHTGGREMRKSWLCWTTQNVMKKSMSWRRRKMLTNGNEWDAGFVHRRFPLILVIFINTPLSYRSGNYRCWPYNIAALFERPFVLSASPL